MAAVATQEPGTTRQTYFDEPGLTHFKDVPLITDPNGNEGVHTELFLKGVETLLNMLSKLTRPFSLAAPIMNRSKTSNAIMPFHIIEIMVQYWHPQPQVD